MHSARARYTLLLLRALRIAYVTSRVVSMRGEIQRSDDKHFRIAMNLPVSLSAARWWFARPTCCH
jgi:hypothetical protein